MNPKVPAATIRGIYNTYEDRSYQDLVEKLGHVVELVLEDKIRIEMSKWHSGINIYVTDAQAISVETCKDTGFVIFIKDKIIEIGN